jgi:uncharacterized repeat protein (TIGR01451 family)
MKHFNGVLNMLPKRLVISVGALLAVLMLSVSTLLAATVRLEGSLGVANVTRNETVYNESASASYDEVLKVQVYYHNREDPTSDKVANDLRIKLNVPTTAGKSQTISGTISSPDANTVNDSVAINLDREDAYLEYIPGSAVWKHNKGTNENVQIVEEKISDEVVYGGTGLVLEDAKPCFNFDATVTILVRVRVPGIKIDKKTRVKGQTEWKTENTAKAGETVEYLLSYQNAGNTTHNSVLIRDNMPPKVTYVPGSTKLTNGAGTKSVADGVTTTGISVGNYGPGSGAHVVFEAKMPTQDKLACGVTRFRNVGIARPEGMNEFYNTASTNVNKECAEQPKKPICEALELKKLDGRKVSATVKYAANGATFKNVTYNFGDNTQVVVTDKTTVEHTYAADGTYTVSASVRFSVNGVDQVVNSDNCAKTVTFSPTTTTTTTTTLPKTGAGSVIGLFAATSAIGAAAHSVISRRRAMN